MSFLSDKAIILRRLHRKDYLTKIFLDLSVLSMHESLSVTSGNLPVETFFEMPQCHPGSFTIRGAVELVSPWRILTKTP